MTLVTDTPGTSAREKTAGVGYPRQEAFLLLLLLGYAGLMWVWGAGHLDLTHSMEAARAVGARTMMRTGDYLVPRLGERVNLAKPPLLYWAIALASLPGGEVTEVTVRLPSALAAMLVLLLLYMNLRRTFGAGMALVSCLAVATLPMVFPAAQVGEVNMLLALGVTLSIVSAFNMLEGRHPWLHAALCGLGLSVGLLAKGPIALLFFVPTMLLYLGYRAGGRLADNWRWSLTYMAAIAVLTRLSLATATSSVPAGAALYAVPVGMLLYFGLRNRGEAKGGWRWLLVLAVVLAFTVPWAVLVVQRLGFEHVREVFVREVWRTRSSEVGKSNQAPIWYYLVRIPGAALPWSLLAIPVFFPGYGAQLTERQRRMLLLARCWLVGSVILFTVISPGRRVRYLLPVFPPISLLAGEVLMRAAAGELRQWMERYARIWAAACFYCLCAAPIMLTVLWFSQGIPPSAWAALMALLAASGAAAGVHWHRRRSRLFAPLVALLPVMLGAKILMDFGLPQVLNTGESPRSACRHIRSHVPAGEDFYVWGEAHPEVLFYLNPEVAGLSHALESHGQALICLEVDRGTVLQSAHLPPGHPWQEVERAPDERNELVLLRHGVDGAPRAGRTGTSGMVADAGL